MLGANGKYIYTLNTIEDKVYGHRIEPDGDLTEVAVAGGIPTSMPGPLSGGIAAWDSDDNGTDGNSGDGGMPGGMPDTGGGGMTGVAGMDGILSMGNVAALLSMLTGGAYLRRMRH